MGTPAARWRVLAAFAAIYLIWGSTYLGIRFAVETLPPFLMTAARWLVAGAIVLPIALRTNRERPTRLHWRSALVIGALLPLAGNGGVTWAQDHGLHSGLAALLVAMVPLWLALFDWLWPSGPRPTRRVALGLLLGFGGVAWLVRPWEGGGDVSLAGGLALVAATFFWALGSIYSRHAPLPRSPLLATGMEMVAGGVLLVLVGLAFGEGRDLELAAVTARSWLAFGYLALFGSLVAFLAYIWLLRVSTPAKVGTYAYVNPVVAVFLGWLLASEPLTASTLVAAAAILAGVAVTTTARPAPPPAPATAPATPQPAPAAAEAPK